jgi:hypothetical protein
VKHKFVYRCDNKLCKAKAVAQLFARYYVPCFCYRCGEPMQFHGKREMNEGGILGRFVTK